jgi:S1-C subfamily serine protease
MMYRLIAKFYAGGIIMVLTRNGENVNFCGTGFICHDAGYFLTCAHIIDLTAELCICVPPPIDQFSSRTLTRVDTLPAMVAQFDALGDVALLKLTGPGVVSTSKNWMGRGESVDIGASVACLGIPFGSRGLHTPKLTGSTICGKSLGENGAKQLHLDANIHEGNSGGPIIEIASNQIVGIVTGRFSPTGNEANVRIGDFALGQESTVSFGVPIEYPRILMEEEKLDV